MLKYRKLIKSFFVSPIHKRLYLLLRIHTFVAKTAMIQFAEILVRYVNVYVNVYMFQVGILFEQDQQIYINTHEMLWYLCIRLTDRNSRRPRDVHRKVLSDRVLFVTCHIIEDKNEIWKRTIWWNYIAIIEKCKITDFFNQCQ